MPNEKRFAISALSKTNHADALNEEILVDKQTGEFLIKTANGDIVSYDYNTRYKEHINEVLNDMESLNTISDIYEIVLDDITLPAVVSGGTNLLTAPVVLSEELYANIIPKNILFHFDIDALKVGADGSFTNEKLTIPNATIRFVLSYNTIDENSGTITVDGSYVDDLKRIFISLPNTIDGVQYAITHIAINEITLPTTVKNNINADVSSGFRYIVNSLFVCIS